MTSYEKQGSRPEVGKFSGFDHITFYVTNAKQAASYYVLRLGFEHVAYKGLETGDREYASHVVRQNKILFCFTSPLNPVAGDAVAQRIAVTGDAVKDVAFTVADCEALYHKAIGRGAVSVQAPKKLEDANGSVWIATVKTYGDTVHTFVQRDGYKGVFLPGFRETCVADPLSSLLPIPELKFIDHIVGNQGEDEMVNAAEWYEKMLDFHRFWSVDDKQIHSEYSALRSIVMTDWDESIKMPINEPAPGKRKSQIQEYVDYHGGAGVQHIALNTPDIINALTVLRARGLDFLSVPNSYYEDVKRRLAKSSVVVKEDLETLQKLNILIDFDDQGYLLQIFSKPVEDRPTLFYEIIQRNNHSGFGAGNFKALFEAIERDQAARGNLLPETQK